MEQKKLEFAEARYIHYNHITTANAANIIQLTTQKPQCEIFFPEVSAKTIIGNNTISKIQGDGFKITKKIVYNQQPMSMLFLLLIHQIIKGTLVIKTMDDNRNLKKQSTSGNTSAVQYHHQPKFGLILISITSCCVLNLALMTTPVRIKEIKNFTSDVVRMRRKGSIVTFYNEYAKHAEQQIPANPFRSQSSNLQDPHTNIKLKSIISVQLVARFTLQNVYKQLVQTSRSTCRKLAPYSLVALCFF
eukprot:TRINITY_DN7855_c0_g1_i6.p3 TRINITY_DN7855_c0_g1~~TRINITY_DN7855_c0_g1_i6.p3  ORF type:complete len:246 (+),score=4.85 TRINITY_DN7855_c0_g1_i6:485-1222(+)